MYARVPAINGVPKIGAVKLISGVSISDSEAVVQIDGNLQAGWTELTEAEYLALVPPVVVIEPESEPTITELKENQLILMDAIATVFETMIGGV